MLMTFGWQDTECEITDLKHCTRRIWRKKKALSFRNNNSLCICGMFHFSLFQDAYIFNGYLCITANESFLLLRHRTFLLQLSWQFSKQNFFSSWILMHFFPWVDYWSWFLKNEDGKVKQKNPESSYLYINYVTYKIYRIL